MRVLLSWLRDYVDVAFSAEELEQRFPMLGIGVEGVERLGDDVVLDLELASNRGDLMGIFGIARELAAATGSPLREPVSQLIEDTHPISDTAHVEILDPTLCSRYVARMIVGVRVGPAPAWMVHRLQACGIRSINNVVDVTNYVMLELGQPLHAFDYDRLHGGHIIVRRAQGERLTTLDGVDRQLDRHTLVIADPEGPVAVAGVIGGAATEIAATTTRVLLEAASFDPVSVRRTSKRLGVRTESSARFERGTDTVGVLRAAARAAQLLAETATGQVLRGAIDIYPAPVQRNRVELRWPRIQRLVGVQVPIDDGVAILRRLGFTSETHDNTVRATVPTFRRDVEREEDLIEEVVRHYGYERIPETMPKEVTGQGTRALVIEADDAVRDVMIRAGLTEILTVSLTNPGTLDSLQLPPEHPWRQAVLLTNPLVEDHSQLRTTLLLGLLEVARVNVNRSVPDIRVFELGRTFHPNGNAVAERRRLSILITGRLMVGTWNMPAESVMATYYHLKGIVEALLDELRIRGTVFAPASMPWLQSGRSASLSLDGHAIGSLGELDPQIGTRYDLQVPVYVADLDLDALLQSAVLHRQYSPLPRFPVVRRDIALIVPATVTGQQVEEVIAAASGELLASAELFDVYTGSPIPVSHRNLAYALTFRSPERTLASDEVDGILGHVKQALVARLQAKIREATTPK